MIIGDPYKLAICIQRIPEWNDGKNTFGNGVLSFMIDGSLFPPEILNITINRELQILISKLSNIPEDEELFPLPTDECLKRIYEKTYPEDWTVDGDDSFNMSPTEYSDLGYYVFAVKKHDAVRFLFSHLKYIKEESRHHLSSPEISEVTIDISTLEHIVEDLKHQEGC